MKQIVLINNKPYTFKDLVTFPFGHIRTGDESQAVYIFLITKTMVQGLDREKLAQMGIRLFNIVARSLDIMSREDAGLDYSIQDMNRLHESSFSVSQINFSAYGLGSRKIDHILPFVCVQRLARILNTFSYWRLKVFGIYFEQIGGKESFSMDVVGMLAHLERFIDTSKIELAKINFAITSAIKNTQQDVNGMQEPVSNKCLMINSEFASRLAGRGNCTLLTNLVTNKNKVLERIDPSNTRHIVNRTGLAEINCYSTIIPRYFNRVILTKPGYRLTFFTLHESLKQTCPQAMKREELCGE